VNTVCVTAYGTPANALAVVTGEGLTTALGTSNVRKDQCSCKDHVDLSVEAFEDIFNSTQDTQTSPKLDI